MKIESNLADVHMTNDRTQAPQSEENYWTQPRLELKAWFQRNAPSLGELYDGALRMIFSHEFPGKTRFVAHAVREIRNRLPDVIAGSKVGGLFDWKNSLDQLAEEWEKSGFTLDETIPHQITEGQAMIDPKILIKPQLYRKIRAILKGHVEAREKPIDSAIRLFMGISPERQDIRDTLRPVVTQWLNVTEWFVKKVHESGSRATDVDTEAFQSHFEYFEITLGALIRDFFKTVEGLDEILEDANS